MDEVVTLTMRAERRLAAMRAALPRIDDALRLYAREAGGRFIRYGSTASGALRATSDVDILADFADDRVAIQACTAADAICEAQGLLPDCRPLSWASDTLRARAIAEGVVLA